MNRYLKTQLDLTVSLLIHDALSTGITTVEFFKADDTVRSMRATIDAKLLPESEKVTEPGPYDLNLVKVFDVEKQAWRSFRIDRLKTIGGVDFKRFLADQFEQGI